MERIEFLIEGRPLPQERPSVTRHGTFDRPRSKAKKKEIALLAMIAARREKWDVAGGQVGVFLEFINPNKLSDLDNLTKLVLDALSGVLWKDDRQVIKIYADKESGADQPHTKVCVWRYPEEK